MDDDLAVVFVVGKGKRRFTGVAVFEDETIATYAAYALNSRGRGGYYVECMPRIVGDNVSPSDYSWISVG